MLNSHRAQHADNKPHLDRLLVLALELLGEEVDQSVVKVLAAQVRVTRRRLHLQASFTSVRGLQEHKLSKRTTCGLGTTQLQARKQNKRQDNYIELTSKMPSSIVSSDTSKVPPPRSKMSTLLSPDAELFLSRP